MKDYMIVITILGNTMMAIVINFKRLEVGQCLNMDCIIGYARRKISKMVRYLYRIGEF